MAANTVPDQYVGAWRRLLEEEPIGSLSDDSTIVWWLQGRTGLYADLRVPRAARPEDKPAAVLKSDHELLALQKSFAGHGVLENGNRYTWHRHVDYHPPDGQDIGVLSINDDGILVEDGADGSYRELWKKEATADDGLFVLELEGSDGQREGFWIVAGGISLRVVGRCMKEGGVGEFVANKVGVANLKSLIADGEGKAKAPEILFTYHATLARYNDASNQWVVQHALDPVLEGTNYDCSLLARDETDPQLLIETVTNAPPLQWRIREQSDGFNPLKL